MGRRVLTALPLALVFAFALAGRCEASILQPGLTPDADEILQTIQHEQTGSSSSSSGATEVPSSARENEPAESEHYLPHAFHPDAPTPGGNSSSSSSSSSTSAGGGTMSFVAPAALGLEDDELTGHLVVCQCLVLPTPPGTELLRPPQSEC